MKYGKNVYHSLVMVTQFGINMLVPIFICSFLGIYLDRWLNTSYWMIILFFLGACAGFRNIYMFAKRVYSIKSEKDTDRIRAQKKEETENDSSRNKKD